MIFCVSYPLSANRYSAVIPSIKWTASLQSALVPSVISTMTGIPSTSTARCIFVLSPLLYVPYLDCLLWLRPRAGVLFYMAYVYHQPLKIGLICQDLKQLLPYSFVSPSPETLMYGTPFSIRRRQVAPVRRIQNTALIKLRLSLAIPPHCPLCPGRCGSSLAHTSSDMSCLC